MKFKVSLIDYEEKYTDEINDIEEKQWGKWGTGNIRNVITKDTCIRLAKLNEEIAGVGYGKVLLKIQQLMLNVEI